MQILKLQLENAKSYENAQFTFTRGTNAIVGVNGAGKSTILEAIGFALFDSMNYRINDFVREGSKRATVTVTILSDLDERRYEITRRCGSSNQYFVFDPELQAKLCEGKADVIVFLKEHMKVDPAADLSAIFTDAVGVPQGTLTAAFLQTPASRKKAFDTLLQVEEYKVAADNMREPGRILRDKIQEIDLSLKEVTTRLERLPELEAQVAKRSKAIVELETDRGSHQKTLDEQLALVNEQRTVQQQIAAAEEQQRSLEQRHASIEREIVSAQQSVSESTLSQQTVAENRSGYEQYEAAQKSQSELNQQVGQRQQLEQQRNQLVQTLSTITAQEETLQRSLAESKEAAKTVTSLAEAVADQEKLEAQIQQVERQCLTIEEAQRSAPQQQKRLVQLQNRVQQLSTQLNSRDALIAERQQCSDQLNEQQNAIQQISHAMGQYKSEAEALKEQVALLKESEDARCPVCEEPLSAEHRTRLITRNDGRLTELRESYVIRRAEEEAAKKAVESAQATLVKLDNQARSLPRPEELAAAQAELAEHELTVQANEQAASKLSELRQELASLQAALSALDNPRQQSALAAQVANRQDQLMADIANQSKERESAEQQMAQFKEQMQNLADIDSALSEVQQTLNEHAAAYQAVLAHRQAAQLLEEREARLQSLKDEQKSVKADEQAIQKELTELAKQFDAEQLAQAEEKAQQIRAQLASIETEITLHERDQQRDQSDIERLQELQKEQATTLQKRESLQTQSDALEMIRTNLRKAGPYITSTLIQQVSSGANEIFCDLMQDYSRHLAWNEDYGISLNVEGRDRQFAQLSGGEQMSAALSVRLALLRELGSIDIAFFDEPTTNLDEARRESLARQILDVKGFQQLFVISHDDTFEQSTENVIRVEKQS